jgi:hypothetical protein
MKGIRVQNNDDGDDDDDDDNNNNVGKTAPTFNSRYTCSMIQSINILYKN